MEAENPKPVLCLMGPTATGKTALALQLHEMLPLEIVSVDSSQVYRGMGIGTAKPTREEQARAPHRLIDIRDPAQSYSAAEFRADALREIGDILNAGRLPLLVGGTMFYFHALEFGLSALPSADPQVRMRLAAEAAERGWATLHARLQTLDPVSAQRISPNDAQRIQRALEIIEVTGSPVSEVTRSSPPEPLPYRLVKVALIPGERTLLRERIARRFHSMLEHGLIGEVEELYGRRDLHPGLPSIRMVGYRQVWRYLTGEINYNQMVEQAVTATRQLAKRQLTWLRSYPEVTMFDPETPGLAQQILEHLSRAALASDLGL